jgi:hypothetical protein
LDAAVAMKVRIVRTLKCEIDGVRIDLFHEGLTYEMSATLATVLVCEGYAEPVFTFLEERRDSTLPPVHRIAADRRLPS